MWSDLCFRKPWAMVFSAWVSQSYKKLKVQQLIVKRVQQPLELLLYNFTWCGCDMKYSGAGGAAARNPKTTSGKTERFRLKHLNYIHCLKCATSRSWKLGVYPSFKRALRLFPQESWALKGEVSMDLFIPQTLDLSGSGEIWRPGQHPELWCLLCEGPSSSWRSLLLWRGELRL